MSQKAIVIGAGVAGIATAIRLRLKGYEVVVFEASDRPGGKLNELRSNGYRFDAGPSLFTLPHLVDDLYRLAGKDPREYFNYRQLPVACRYLWEDGTVLNAYSDADHFAREVEEVLDVPSAVIDRFLQHSQRIYDATGPIFLERSLHRISTYFNRHILKPVLNFPRLDMLTTMDRSNRKRLKHPKLVQLFNRMATYNGSSPYRASGVLNVIASLEHNDGAYLPQGGMYAIAQGIYGLAKEAGVQFTFRSEVERIIYTGNRIKGVRVNGMEHLASIVVSNMDVVPTYQKLLQKKVPPFIRRQERSSSALIFYWGIRKKFSKLESHNIFFSENYPEEFEYLFERLDMYDDPTVYIAITSRQNPQDAPEYGDNWFVMVNAPHNNGQDWDVMKSRIRKAIIEKLSRMLGEDIEPLIETEETLDPVLIEARTSSYKGSLYGASSNNWLSAFLRHPNSSLRMRGLYFAGGSVHPGGGIPLCLMSSKIVTDQIPDLS